MIMVVVGAPNPEEPLDPYPIPNEDDIAGSRRNAGLQGGSLKRHRLDRLDT